MERIKRLEEKMEKQEAESSLRSMWRECFADPEDYEDFYFSNVYRRNIVYTIADKGMLHLNPYLCILQGKETILHYIVGVGTRSSQRRKGIMRQLLKQSLLDMYQKKEPFTYLMPADVRYYEPFSFVSISQKKESVIGDNPGDKDWLAASDWKKDNDMSSEEDVQYLEYCQLLKVFDKKQQCRIFNNLNDSLSSSYDVFAKHDEAYFELLAKEKGCQNGNVVFLFRGEPSVESIEGFFAYSMDGQEMYVEQYVTGKSSDKSNGGSFSYVAAYCEKKDKLLSNMKIIEQFPFMVRIVNLTECLKQFGDCFYSMAREGKRLLVTDHILLENSGIYTFTLKENQVSVRKQCIPEDMEEAETMWDMQMTIEEAAQQIFCKGKENKIFFAEVV